jgi:hypothetical protein
MIVTKPLRNNKVGFYVNDFFYVPHLVNPYNQSRLIQGRLRSYLFHRSPGRVEVTVVENLQER